MVSRSQSDVVHGYGISSCDQVRSKSNKYVVRRRLLSWNSRPISASARLRHSRSNLTLWILAFLVKLPTMWPEKRTRKISVHSGLLTVPKFECLSLKQGNSCNLTYCCTDGVMRSVTCQFTSPDDEVWPPCTILYNVWTSLASAQHE